MPTSVERHDLPSRDAAHLATRVTATQGETLDEAHTILRKAVAMVLEANRALAEEDLAGITVIRERLSA